MIPESCSWPGLEQCPAFWFSCLYSHIGPLSAFPELLPEPALLSSDFTRFCILVAFPGALVSFVPGTGKAKCPSLELCSLWWLIVLFSRGKGHFASGLQGQRGALLVFDVPVGQKCLCGGCQWVLLSLLLVCCAVLLLEHDTGFPQQRLLVLCSLPYPAPRVIAQFPHSELKSLLLLSTAPFIAAAQGQPLGFSLSSASPCFSGFLPCHVHTSPLSCTCRSRLASDTEFSLQT